MQCYELAPPRIRQYLAAEIEYIIDHIESGDSVLDLGCGYGRILPFLAQKARAVTGIDISLSNVEYGRHFIEGIANCRLLVMDAACTGFRDGCFDRVICIQNGVSAFGIDPDLLMKESVRITKCGGTVFLSSYAPGIWQERLEWFRLQSAAGLIGEIDMCRTRDGVIVCKDGFKATTVGRDEFLRAANNIPAVVHLEEVDGSSVFCTLQVLERPSKSVQTPSP